MQLLKEIIVGILEKEEINIVFPNLNISLAESVEMQSYQTLKKIKAIIDDDSLSDFDCIDGIVRVFESIGSDGGIRHDFG